VAPGSTRVPTGSIASPVYSPDSLYGYSDANPRSQALANNMGQDVWENLGMLPQGQAQNGQSSRR
jgi:hypothetical protein